MKNLIDIIKGFFDRVFKKRKLLAEGNGLFNNSNYYSSNITTNTNLIISNDSNAKSFDINNICDLFLKGEIDEENLSREQIMEIEEALNKKIDNLKVEVFNTKEKLEKKLKKDKGFVELVRKHGKQEIFEEEMTEKQINQLEFFYQFQIEKLNNQV